MISKKKKIKEGDFFCVPLCENKYAIGLAARENKGVVLAYFFNTLFEDIPNKIESTLLIKENVILIEMISSLGIRKGIWKILDYPTNFIFDRNYWNIPIFFHKESLLEETYYAVKYDEDLLNSSRYIIRKEETLNLFEDGLAGYIALENNLKRKLEI